MFIVIDGIFKLYFQNQNFPVTIFGEEAIIDSSYDGKWNHTVIAETDGLLLEIDKAKLDQLWEQEGVRDIDGDFKTLYWQFRAAAKTKLLVIN